MDFPEPQTLPTASPAPAANGAAPKPARPANTVLVFGLAALLVVAAAIGIGAYFALRPSAPSSAPPAGPTLTAKGAVGVTGSLNWTVENGVCRGVGKRSELRGGAKVTVTVDGKSASGALNPGELVAQGSGEMCVMTFQVAGVPQASGAYWVQVPGFEPRQVPANKLTDIQVLI